MSLVNPSLFSRTSINRGGVAAILQSDRGDITSNETTASTSFIASSLTVTIPNNASAKTLLCSACTNSHSVGGAENYFRWDIGGSIVTGSGVENSLANRIDALSLFATTTSDGSVVTIEKRTTGATQTLYGTADRRSNIEAITIGGGGLTVTIQRDESAANETLTGATWQDTTQALTVANRSGGKYISVAAVPNDNNGFQNNSFRIEHNSIAPTAWFINTANGVGQSLAELTVDVNALDGNVCVLQYNIAGGTATLFGTNDTICHLEVFEVSGGTITELEDFSASNESTSSSTYVAMTLSVTLSNNAGGKYMAVFQSDDFSTAGRESVFAWNHGGVRQDGVSKMGRGANWVASVGVFQCGDTDGGTLTLDWKSPAGTLVSNRGGAGNRDKGMIRILEIAE